MSAQQVIVNDRVVACTVCGGDRFSCREITMNTPGASFLGFDWANASADGAICLGCGYVHQFYGDHHRFADVG